jgi:PAS domain S-box-containing protein
MVASLTSNGVLITDSDERIEWANEAFLRISGYALDELLGRHPGELLQGPGTDPTVVDRVRASLRTTGTFSETLLNYRKDGTPYWVAIDAHVIRDDGEDVGGYVAVHRDVTDERAQRAALAAERDFARAVMETVAQGLTVTGPDLRFTYVNPAYAAMTGYRAEELVGMHPHDVTLPAAGVDLDAVSADRRAGRTSTYRARLRRRDGGELDVLITGVPVMRDGRLAGSISVVTDISAEVEQQRLLRAAHEASVRASKSRSAFLARISHELRSPLNAIIGYSEMLVDTLPADADRRAAERIERAGRSMVSLIDDMLELSRSEGGFFEVRLERTSLHSVTSQVVEAMRGSHDLGAITFALEVAPAPPVVLDRQRTHQVLANLASNAIKYGAGERGRLALRARIDGDTLVFEVEDEGPGVPAGMRDQVFESYTRGDASGALGFGIGLPLSRQLARVMGGDVTLADGPLGGTLATLTLPVVPEPEGDGARLDGLLVVGGYDRVARLTGAIARSGLTRRWCVAEERASAERLVGQRRFDALIWLNPASASETTKPFDPRDWAASSALPPTLVVEAATGDTHDTAPSGGPTWVVPGEVSALGEAHRALRRAILDAGGDRA